MATTSIIRPTISAPAVGSRYGFANGHRTFQGRVIGLRKLNATHTIVEVELSTKDHRRLLGIDPAQI